MDLRSPVDLPRPQLVSLLATAVVERRVRNPIIDLALLRNRVFASALLSMTLAMLALFAVSFMLPFYFEALRGFSVANSGITPDAFAPDNCRGRACERFACGSHRLARAGVGRVGDCVSGPSVCWQDSMRKAPNGM